MRLKIAATRISTTGIPTAGVIAEAVTRTGIVGITAAGFIVVEVVVAPILAVVAGKLIVEPHPGGGTGSRRAARRRRPTSGAGPRDGGTVGRLGEPRWRIAVAHRLRHQSRSRRKKSRCHAQMTLATFRLMKTSLIPALTFTLWAACLGLLTALEDILGSLGPTVNQVTTDLLG